VVKTASIRLAVVTLAMAALPAHASHETIGLLIGTSGTPHWARSSQPFAVIAVATPSLAAVDYGAEPNFEGTHVCGHKFEPGPIVDGHNRQPTPAEFAARTRELHALSEGVFDAPQEGQIGACRR
jgi:hypothetical protein